MKKTWFTSDTHFGHNNIIKYCNRPFASAQEMDEAMIANWNLQVRPDDTVYHLGDFAFTDAAKLMRLLDRLNGTKILVYGNHDKPVKSSPGVREKFERCVDYHEIYIQDPSVDGGKQHIVLCHYAMLVWNKGHRGSWMLHGHSHGSLKYPYKSRILDVGVDSHFYAPISYEEVKQKMKEIVPEAVDHH